MIAAEVEAEFVGSMRRAYNLLTELGDRVEDGYDTEIVNSSGSRIQVSRRLLWQAIDQELGIGHEVMTHE